MNTKPESPLMVFCTCPDEPTARSVAEALVSERLAACVSALPGAVSTYRWEGEIKHDTEVLLVIKTTSAKYSSLEARLADVHPYELPEILAVPVSRGLAPYIAWIEESTTI